MAGHLVFVGGGHAHLTALANVACFTRKGHRVTVISPSGYHYYSGMGPGVLSGIYAPWEIRFNIRKMIEDRGGRFIEGSVARIDPKERKLILKDGTTVSYHVASFNTGSEVPAQGLAVPDRNVFPVKPIINLYRARSLLLNHRGGPPRIVVVGGGPAGVEVAANVWKLLQGKAQAVQIIVVAGDDILPGAPTKVRSLALDSLERRKILVLRGVRVRSFEKGHAILTDGRSIPFDYAFLAMGVKPAGLFQESGLPVGKDGGMLVNANLQSVAYPELFGGGDCISFEGSDLPKVGVYAVRQNPILYHNLSVALDGGRMKPFIPQTDFMLILNMGDGTGIFWRKELVWNGRVSFLLKNFIDRRFMRKFQVSGELSDRFVAIAE